MKLSTSSPSVLNRTLQSPLFLEQKREQRRDRRRTREGHNSPWHEQYALGEQYFFPKTLIAGKKKASQTATLPGTAK
jgi:hypothetical protein